MYVMRKFDAKVICCCFFHLIVFDDFVDISGFYDW